MIWKAIGHAVIDTIQIAILLSWIGYIYKDNRNKKRAVGKLFLNAADHTELIGCHIGGSINTVHEGDIVTLKVVFVEEGDPEDGEDV